MTDDETDLDDLEDDDGLGDETDADDDDPDPDADIQGLNQVT